MTAKKWAGIVSAVVVGVVLAALVLWAVTAVAQRTADARSEAEHADRVTQLERENAEYEAYLEEAAEQCDEDARAAEAGTFDFESADPLLLAGDDDYESFYDRCMELAEIKAPRALDGRG
jgi:flagellar biosynthesis/type III secretory pathway M-ring protein FliF/YscJ